MEAKVRIPLGVKLAVLTGGLVLMVIATMSRLVLRQARESYLGELGLQAQFFSRVAREAMFPKRDDFQLHFALHETKKVKGIAYAAIIGADGIVLSHSDPARIGRPEEPGVGGDLDFRVPVKVEDRTLGAVRVGATPESLAAALAPQRRKILQITLGSLLAALLGTILLVSRMTRAIPLLARAAQRLGAGDLGARVDFTSRDEIGVLAGAFNAMAEDNQALVRGIVEEKQKVQTAFAQMKEGALLLDAAGKTLMMNDAAKGILGVDAAPPDFGAGFAGFEGVPDLVDAGDGGRRWRTCDISRETPKTLILELSIGRLDVEGGAVGWLVVFRDVTQLRKEDSIAREILDLMSHKFRTPLMVVMGHMEMIAAEPGNLSDFQKEALAKVNKRHNELSDLFAKMLTYSAAQGGAGEVEVRKQPNSVVAFVEAAIERAQRLPRAEGAAFRFDRAAAETLPILNADIELLDAALVNLLENAVKFNAGKEKRVEVRVSASGGRLRVEVADNGPGIPPEEREKVWDKFYQVEEFFTGQVEGLGLGLTYVKAVIEAHGGAVGLDSEPGKGSTFWFEIPAD